MFFLKLKGFLYILSVITKNVELSIFNISWHCDVLPEANIQLLEDLFFKKEKYYNKETLKAQLYWKQTS